LIVYRSSEAGGLAHREGGDHTVADPPVTKKDEEIKDPGTGVAHNEDLEAELKRKNKYREQQSEVSSGSGGPGGQYLAEVHDEWHKAHETDLRKQEVAKQLAKLRTKDLAPTILPSIHHSPSHSPEPNSESAKNPAANPAVQSKASGKRPHSPSHSPEPNSESDSGPKPKHQRKD
jgi:hypothetical protein